MRPFILCTLMACWLLLPLLGSADTTIIGGAARVIDADTLEVKGERVRLQGIDAPETRQMCERASGILYPCGLAATRALHERIGDGNVSCAIDSRDPLRSGFGGVLRARRGSECVVDFRGTCAGVPALQHAVRRAGRGSSGRPKRRVGGAFVAPWDWRRGERLHAGSSTADSPRSTGEHDALAMYDDNRNGRITCREARRHGIAPVGRNHPAYRYMRDGDGDGVVCE